MQITQEQYQQEQNLFQAMEKLITQVGLHQV
jgi:hypothetical protein